MLSVALRELRQAAGQPTIAGLARQIGSSETTVRDALSGRRPPARGVLEALVVALGADSSPWLKQWYELDRARRRARSRVGRYDAAGVRRCEVPGCPNKRGSGRYCGTHDAHHRRFGDPTAGRFRPKVHPPTCAVEGCDGTYYAVGLCRRHYSRLCRQRERERRLPTPSGQ